MHHAYVSHAGKTVVKFSPPKTVPDKVIDHANGNTDCRWLTKTQIVLLSFTWCMVTITNADEQLGKLPAWTTSRIRGTPDPPPPYHMERVFPDITFNEPVVFSSHPTTDRLFIAERFGKIYSFPKTANATQADLCLDVKSSIFGMALHPDFDRNGYLYITYLNPHVIGRYILPEERSPEGTRVSRFQLNSSNPPQFNLASEHVIIQWPSGGHNGGCLAFGPDGYLYIALGDASDIADMRSTGQDIGDLPASIMRIDVNQSGSSHHYRIPEDNPFVGFAGARPEIWAYGLRQVWRMSFDRETGELWAGEVGQDLWESVHRIQPGGNYGWSVTEGSHAFRPERTRGPTPILPPVHEYDHTQGRSITGGYVYRGSRLPELRGAYLFADYDSGRIWGLRYNGTEVTWHQLLSDTTRRFATFGEDNEGEIYLVDHIGGGLYRLAATSESPADHEFPRSLSQTGIFASVSQLTPSPGVVPFSINATAWSDGIQKQWVLGLPHGKKIEFDGMKYPDPTVPPGWKFPDGTVIAETLSLELVSGDPASSRRIETRILHHQHIPGTEEMGDQYWTGYTYVWNDEQTDAVLLETPQGLDKTYTIQDSSDTILADGKRTLNWHIPSRAECTLCHNMSARYVISGNTLQFNRNHDYGQGMVSNQIHAFNHWNLFSKPLRQQDISQLPRLPSPADQSLTLAERARSYLHTNCAFCHRRWGGGNADFKLVYTLDLDTTGLLGVRPAHGTFHLPDANLITPGDPFRSVLFYRLAKLGNGRMPRAGSQITDVSGLQLIHDWIHSLPTTSNTPPPTGDTLDTEILAATTVLQKASSLDNSRQAAERLLGSTLGAFVLSWTLEQMPSTDNRRQDLIELGAKHPIPDVRDLFERFLPMEQRTQRLGETIDPNKILSMNGNTARGRELFLATTMQCRNCHQVYGTGTELGPDLSQIGKKYNPAQILESIIDPSKTIDPKHMAFLVTTTSGKVYSGLLVQRNQDGVVLKTPTNESIQVPTSEIENLLPQKKILHA